MVDENPPTKVTDDQLRVQRTLVEAARELNPNGPIAARILDRIIAERLGMTVEEVRAHAKALEDLCYLVRGEVVDSDEDFYLDWEDDPSVVESRRQERVLESLSMDEQRVYEAYLMAQETDRPHRTHTEMAAQLGMTVQEIDVIAEKLSKRGLLNSAWDGLTEDQKRVLMAMPAWRSDMPEPGPSTAELAEQLEMSVEDVRECIRVLDDGRWLWGYQPRSVLDALMTWGWHTPANELAERLHMDIEEVDQRLLELAEIGYDVRLI